MANTFTDAKEEQFPTLTVYKASAGSGKTFTLALEYIKLLIDKPYSYNSILAVTFTNKATEEMKMRILSTLYGLAHRHDSVSSYMEEIVAAMPYNEDEVVRRAGKALRVLLHNYHFFRVQTIDTFFQSVLRNLARELQLNANLRVGLNNSQVVEEAVDGLVDSLADDKKLRSVIKGYMEEKVNEGKSWNVINQIKKFGGNIFSEIYKRNRRQMDKVFEDKDFFANYIKMMYDIQRETSEKYKAMGKEILEVLESKSLSVSDFAYGNTGPASYFKKLADGLFFDDEKVMGSRIKNSLEDSGSWVKKTDKRRDMLVTLVDEYLIPAINRIEVTRSLDAQKYKTSVATLKHINDVRLLRRIEEEAHKLNDASQRFMLSDTQSLLREIIDDDDSPFVFEKIGSVLDHVMIDEFQDTSTIQWANFKTLLKECMSKGMSNLIVGDVKQSIYRFRSGDWQLLNDIDREFDGRDLCFKPRLTNWRSKRNVILFNNIFFELLAQLEVRDIVDIDKQWAQSLSKAYEDVKQQIPDSHCADEGYVRMEMLPSDELCDMEQKTLSIINDLISRGAKQKDIAILMRNKREIPAMAKFVEDNSGVHVVSAEAFRLDASPAVRMIVNAMRVLVNERDNISLAALVKDYAISVLKIKDVDAFIQAHAEDLMGCLPSRFGGRLKELHSYTLHDLAEELVKAFDICSLSKEGAYVTTLFDNLNNFSNEMASMLNEFIEAWDEEIAEKTIETTDVDGIRIMTIHKSKGLEFKHVIIPYCNWSGNPPYSTIWVEPKVQPFSQLPMVPLEYKTINSLKGTLYQHEGEVEHIQNVVDNLNLLYVAMTRAGHSLFVIGERNEKAYTRSKLMCETIGMLPAAINGKDVVVEGLESEDSSLVVSFGQLGDLSEKKDASVRKEVEYNPFTIKPTPVPIDICSHENDSLVFLQSNDSKRFADDSLDDADSQRYIKIGTVMHELFSTIKTLDDVEPALKRMEFDGMLYDPSLTKEQLRSVLEEKFKDEQVRNWFSDKWKVYNERNILIGTNEYRPDRVMTDGHETVVVDYKFGKVKDEHKTQVKRYMNLLEEMGMPDVKGYLWYVSFNKIEKVE